MKARTIFAAAALCGLASAAQAEGWTIHDLGSVDERATCMEHARQTFSTYRAQHGADGFTGESEWTVAGYDLRGDVVDALIICPIEAGLVAPFLIVFNTDGDDEARDTLSNRLAEMWDTIVEGGGMTPPPATGATPTK